jgi:transposase
VPSVCSRIARTPGSCRRIRSSSTRSRTSSGCTSTRPSEPWCCAWTRSPRSRPWTARRRSCRCCPAPPSAPPTTHKRHGTSSLYAALDITTGKVIGSLHARHRAIEFKKFLTTIEKEVPADLTVHLVLDNASTHKTPAIQKWLLAHPRFVVHFTPTSSSWLNLVERWFGELTTKKLQRGAHTSVRALNADIRAWIKTWNDNPRPYVWTKTADQILDSIARYCTRINDSGH